MPDKDYNKIAAAKITRPSQTKKKPRILIYSRQKKGKTTFCASAGQGKILILDPEQGTSELKTADPDTWHITKWEDLDEAHKFLLKGDHAYEWVAVDGLTKMNKYALDYVLRVKAERSLDERPDLIRRQDYGQSGAMMRDMMTSFDNLRKLGVIFTAQEKQMESSSSEEDTDAVDPGLAWVADLPASPRGHVYSLVDVIGRIYLIVNSDDEDKPRAERRLWLAESDQYDTGYRSDFALPNYIVKPTLPKLLRLMETGKTTRPKANA